MFEQISKLLLQHECVIIPDFGAFVGSYEGAAIDPSTATVKPPYKKIVFNKTLSSNDGVLINHVALLKGISFEEARGTVTAFAKECAHDLFVSGSISFPDLGKLYYDANHQLQFEQDQNSNLLKSAIGLPLLEITPLEKAPAADASASETEDFLDTANISVEEKEESSSAQSKSNRGVLPWLLLLLGVGFIFYTLIANYDKLKSVEDVKTLCKSIFLGKETEDEFTLETDTSAVMEEGIAVNSDLKATSDASVTPAPIRKKADKTSVSLTDATSKPKSVTAQKATPEQVKAMLANLGTISVEEVRKNNPNKYIVISSFTGTGVGAVVLAKKAADAGYDVILVSGGANAPSRIAVIEPEDKVNEALGEIRASLSPQAWVLN